MILGLKKITTYVAAMALLFSNVVSAGKDFVSEGQDWEHPLTTIRPNTFSSTREINALHIYESGEIIAQNLEGNKSSIKPHNQPHEIRDAIARGQLSSLLNHFNLYVTKPGEELKIQLMGGLKGGMKRGGRDPTTKCMSFDRPGGNNITVCFPCYNGCGSNTGSSSQGNSGGSAHDGYDGGGGRTYQDEYGSSWQLHAESHYASIHAEAIRREEAADQEEQRKQQLAQLDYTLQYHKSNGAKVFTTLTASEEGAVIKYAHKVCLEGKCKPDTEALKQAIKKIVYEAPAHHVLDWYKSQDAPGVQYYKKLTTTHSQQIIETAKELAYGEGHKPDSATISRAYDTVMTGELKYVFDYHKQTTKVDLYQELTPEHEQTLIREAIGNMKTRPGDFKQPDTSPLTESFRYHRTLGEALLKGYGHAVDDLLCATLGSCPAHANYIKLGMEILKQAPRAVTWVGLSASTMWNGKVKNWITEGVDWVKPHILHTPIEQLVIDIAIMQRWGEDAPKILSTPAELEKAIKIEMGQYDGQKISILNEDYIGAPKTLPAFPEATRAREKTYVKGAGLRKRWRDKDHIYEWDSRHGKVEKYTSQGKHLGEFDPNTGEQTKPADPSRRVEK